MAIHPFLLRVTPPISMATLSWIASPSELELRMISTPGAGIPLGSKIRSSVGLELLSTCLTTVQRLLLHMALQPWSVSDSHSLVLE